MCIAIVKPRGATIPKENLEECFRINDDGAGFAVWVKVGNRYTVEVRKGFFTFDDFWAAWSKYGPEYKALLHFRISTHGGISKDNCHPFLVKNGDRTMAVIHNGVLGAFTRLTDTTKSDTRAFVETVIAPLHKANPDFLMRGGAIATFLEDGVGYGNKVAMLDDRGRHVILNGHTGTMHRFAADQPEVWFSNHSFRKYVPTKAHTAQAAFDAEIESEYGSAEFLRDMGVCAIAAGAIPLDPDDAVVFSDEDLAHLTGGDDPPKVIALPPAPAPKTVKEIVQAAAKTTTPNFEFVGYTTLKDYNKTAPEKEVRRVNDRRSMNERDFWEDGYTDAREGASFMGSSCTEAYYRGFMSAIEDMSDTEPFKKGVLAHKNNKVDPVPYLTDVAKRSYRAGVQWAIFKQLRKEENNALVNTVVGGGAASDVPGDGDVLDLGDAAPGDVGARRIALALIKN